MTQRRTAFLAFGLIFALRPGCGPFKPKKESEGPPHKVSEKCLRDIDPCDVGCHQRQQGLICSSCCSEQLILCDEGKPYDVKKCETIEREVRGQ
ncbi:MAG: hypothetical protein IPM54_22900 [Polyangiaceae bacterium]|nr:hypothetical protein [Polyangiaceae bacterium]